MVFWAAGKLTLILQAQILTTYQPDLRARKQFDALSAGIKVCCLGLGLTSMTSHYMFCCGLHAAACPHAVCRAHRMLISACNLILCPIHGLRGCSRYGSFDVISGNFGPCIPQQIIIIIIIIIIMLRHHASVLYAHA